MGKHFDINLRIKTMRIAIVYDHRGRTKAGQEGPVEVRITHERKPYYISTGIKVTGRLSGVVMRTY